jgi:hypothetical protein
MTAVLQAAGALAMFSAISTTASAHWLPHAAADGKPKLSAPAPRMPDGKPDLSHQRATSVP